MPRIYTYVGPHAIARAAADEPVGALITSPPDLDAWLEAHPDALTEGATFVVDPSGVLRLAPRRSEHVACAAGGHVLAAGEIVFTRRRGAIVVEEATNQSTGYCPEPESFESLASALDRLGVARPGAYTMACTFRWCVPCRQTNLVKEDWFECPCCGAALPREWNFEGRNVD